MEKINLMCQMCGEPLDSYYNFKNGFMVWPCKCQKQKERESLYPTCNLRFIYRNSFAEQRDEKVLQQRWESPDGQSEWRDVEIKSCSSAKPERS